MKTFILHLLICMQILTACITAGACKLNADAPAEESLELSLPQWPPQDSFTEAYPPLSRWQIQFTGAEEQNSFFTTDSTVRVQVKKNRPFCIIAQPVTFTSDSNECTYFKPAGYLYTEASHKITWEQGYLAGIMKKLFREGLAEYNSPVDVEYYAGTFNWKKAQETIDKKINSSSLFYNPWLLSDTVVLEGISSRSFKASLLNSTGCTALPASTLTSNLPSDYIFLSSFIPENFSLSEKKQFTVMKNSPIIIGDGSNSGYFVTYKSSKNISLEFIYLPIYIEDI